MNSEIRRINFDDDLICGTIYGMLNEEEQGRLQGFIDASAELWAGFYNAELVIFWGLIPRSCLSDTAYMWSMTFPSVAKCKKSFVKLSYESVQRALDAYEKIVGVCVVGQGSMRWLKYLGAEFESETNGQVAFTIRKQHG